MRLRVLGCSGGIGGRHLRTTSFLVDGDVLLDAGTGVGDLSLAELSLIDHIFVTHSHLDHVASIPFLRLFGLPQVLLADQWPAYRDALWSVDGGDVQPMVDLFLAAQVNAMDLTCHLLASDPAEPGAGVWPVATGIDSAERMLSDLVQVHLRDRLSPEVAEMVYYGFWFVPKMDALMAFSREAQQHVTGEVTLGFYKGNVLVRGRTSPNSLYDAAVASMEAGGSYDQTDAEGFLRIQGLPGRVLGRVRPRKY